MTRSRYRVAVVGCGALGSFYGARLARAGQDVHFLLRSDYDVVRRDGVRIEDAEGGFTVRPAAARDAGEIGPVDLVLIGLKTTANGAFPTLVPPLVGRETLVLTLQNGLGNEEALAALFGPDRILGGLCFVCLNRIAPGVIRHLAHGRIVMGEYGRPAGARTRAIAGAFEEAGVPCTVAEDLEAAHWEKLIWNIPFNGLGVAGAAGLDALAAGRVVPGRPPGRCLPTDVLLGDPRWESRVWELMQETLRIARAQGLQVPESSPEIQITRTRSMGSYWASTLLDFEKGLPLELDSLFREPLRRARSAGVAAPHLEALVGVLEGLEAWRERHSASTNTPA